MIRSSCPICGNRSKLKYLWKTSIVRCSNCSFAFADELPTLGELESIYSSEYFHGEVSYANYLADKIGLQRHFQQRISTLGKYSSGGKLFEAGCAFGFFLDLARQYWEVSGIDISDAATDYAKNVLNLCVERGDLESHPPEPNTYDVVTLWDTIEHLYDPVTAVRTSVKALRPNGILALTTGDIDALLPRLQRQSWRLVIPVHLYYFSRKSISYLLNDYGLEIVHFSYASYYRSLRQMLLALTWKKNDVRWRVSLRDAIGRLPGMGVQIPLNLYDIMFVVARKRAS